MYAELLKSGSCLAERETRRMEPHRERSEGARGALIGPAAKRIWFESDGEWFLGFHDGQFQELLAP